jgi:hypothetical protein
VGTAERFRQFARFEAASSSPSYARLARFVAENEALLALLDELEPDKRQPNLLFAAVRFLDGPIDSADRFGEFIDESWGDLSQLMSGRSTQTNEAARTATFLPLLARLRGPLTLIEVGASAGLCLYPDRYSISYNGGPPLTASPVQIPVTTTGAVPIPDRLPTIAARIGIDLNPLDVNNAEDLAWLNACIWPEHQARRARLAAAAAIVAADPPQLVRGDLVAEIDGVLDAIPAGTTAVVFHSAVLYYLDPDARSEFTARVRGHHCVVWISNEAPGVIADLSTDLAPPTLATSPAYFIVALNGTTTVGISDPHGAWLNWPP